MTPECNQIQDFYSGQSVFLTGGSGCLGKAILEKLLRSCPNLSKVYVLLRPKKSQGVDERLQDVLDTPIFDVLRRNNPTVFGKVVAICGDIEQSLLGMSMDSRDLISNSVSIVIHAAASVKFNDPLIIAFNTNYKGTERVLNLCKGLKNLKAFVHVSTAYANCDHPEIKEEVYIPENHGINPQIISKMTEKEAAAITPLLVGNKPNTYTCSKAHAEYLLKQQGTGLPICIVRPSIVVSTWKEPQPGFVDCYTGIPGFLAASMKRVLASLPGKPSNILDLIPLDITVNLIVAAGWDVAKNRTEEIPVYNCCSGSLNPITNKKIAKYGTRAIHKVCGPPKFSLSKKLMWMVENPILHFLAVFFLQFLPYFLLDGISLIFGRKPRMLKILKNLYIATESTTFFRMNEFKFETNNMGKLEKRMSAEDKKIFYWDLASLKWPDFFMDYVSGINKWIFKEENI